MAASGTRFFDQPFLFRLVNVGWDVGGWGVLAIDMPQNMDISNPHGFFPIGPFAVGQTLTPNQFFMGDDGNIDRFNWMWFAQIPPLPPKLEELYSVIEDPVKDRWIIDGYINAPAERNDDQDRDLEEQSEKLNALFGYTYNEVSLGHYIRVDPETTENAGSPWAGTGDYPVPQTIYKKLYGSRPDREWRYWYRYLPIEPEPVKRNAVRLTFVLNFAGGDPAFSEPEPFFNAPGQEDEHLPSYDMKFKLDIYTGDVVLTATDTTLEGPTVNRTYSETRSVPYTQSGNVVTIDKTGFV